MIELTLILFILVLSIFLGLELISKVPAILHTPLMSGANAISGITLIGTIYFVGTDIYKQNYFAIILGFIAVILATINVVGGYMVTHRMLKMFKPKHKDQVEKR